MKPSKTGFQVTSVILLLVITLLCLTSCFDLFESPIAEYKYDNSEITVTINGKSMPYTSNEKFQSLVSDFNNTTIKLYPQKLSITYTNEPDVSMSYEEKDGRLILDTEYVQQAFSELSEEGSTGIKGTWYAEKYDGGLTLIVEMDMSEYNASAQLLMHYSIIEADVSSGPLSGFFPR